MEGCVRPVKRERVPGNKSQLNGGSDDRPQISHRHRHHYLCHHRLLGHDGSEAARGGAEVFAIKVSDKRITTTDIGPTNGGNCVSLALSPSGTLYSMCGPLFGTQQLATIDPTTGRANLFGVAVPGLTVMAMAFARDGTLYAVGDCNPNANFECIPGSDPNYN